MKIYQIGSERALKRICLLPQIYDDYNDTLEGDMSIPTTKRNTTEPGAPDFNTLDEPIKETIVGIRFALQAIWGIDEF